MPTPVRRTRRGHANARRRRDVGSVRPWASSAAEWLGAVGAALVGYWLFLDVRPRVVDHLEQRWDGHPLLLAVVGWAPVGAVLTGGLLVALRSDRLRRGARTMPVLERSTYLVLGALVAPLALLLSGFRGRYRVGDARAVIDDVAATSPSIATGIAFGNLALTLFLASSIVFAITRTTTRIPRPGWSPQLTVASWCAVAVVGSLACLVTWSGTVPGG